ncbi:MAG: ABC-type transport auxiliary lipoprotein family protein [Paracoccaceae bacterium]
MRALSALIALTLTLPGCSALSALSGGPALDVFELLPHTDAPLTCGRGRVAELVVELPKTRSTLDSDRIMIRPSTLQTQYLPDAKWGDTVPVSVQNLLVQSFGRYDAFTHVGRAPLGSSGDYALISEIGDFNAEVQGKGALIRLSVDAQLVRESDARVVSRGRFVTQGVSPSTRTADLVPAFDAAAQDLTRQITDWGTGALGIRACR